jgi:hypothetical protein
VEEVWAHFLLMVHRAKEIYNPTPGSLPMKKFSWAETKKGGCIIFRAENLDIPLCPEVETLSARSSNN